MATIAIIHGGGDSGASWAQVGEALRALGHQPVAVDLPSEDVAAGWREYADSVVRAVHGAKDLVLVAHSLGGFTAPLVCERVPVRALILVCAMIPQPGALGGSYWQEAGYVGARFDEDAFFHDLSPEAVQVAKRAERAQQDTPMSEPHPMRAWPAVQTHYILGSEDRVFPARRTRELVRERLGIEAEEIATGHLPYLAKPHELAQRIAAHAR